MKVYVEGGGDAAALKTACRKGFSTFLGKAGLDGYMPRIVACGSRRDAFDSFCTALRNNEAAMLLVDSEAPVVADAQQGDANRQADREKWQPWLHLEQREGNAWKKPAGSEDVQCHLMVQCMEAWLLADRDTLTRFFGQGFKEKALPSAGIALEETKKSTLYDSLAAATSHCKTKSVYGKGDHSFELLALIDPAKVLHSSPWARRFVETLKVRMNIR